METAHASRDRLLIVLLAVSYGCVAVATLVLPPARTLHAESSAICAAAGSLFVGLCVIHSGRGLSVRRAVTTALVWPLPPLAVLTLVTAIRPSCLTFEGFLLYAAFVPPSAIFGAALAFAIRHRVARRPTLVFVAAGVLVAVSSAAFDLLGHPQFYSYSHVFGGVLGPIYDRMLAVRPGVFTFRLVTLLWAGLLFLVAQPATKGVLASFGVARQRVAVAVLISALGCSYLWRGQLGFNTTSDTLRAALSGFVATEHFDLHFDTATPAPFSAEHVAATAEYEYARLTTELGVAPGKRIAVFLYPDASRRARLTGARNTSIAPVWLRSPQIHMLASRVDDSFSHELVHVFSREIGAPVIRASPLVGLVEGLAGALEAPATGLDADAAVRVAAHEFGWTESDLAGRLRGAMTPTGFWSGRGAVNYALSASFARYLLDNYPKDAIASVYASGRFRTHTSLSLDSLSSSWAKQVVADTSAIPLMARRQIRSAFSAASLFELTCPHAIPHSFSALIAGDGAWRRGDTLVARANWEEAARDSRLDAPVSERVALAAMYEGDTRPARNLAERADSTLTASALILIADANAVAGNASIARSAYQSAMDRIRGTAIDDEAAVALRMTLAEDGEAVGAFYNAAVSPSAAGTSRAWGQSRQAAKQGHYQLADSLLRSVSVPAADSLESLMSWYHSAQLARYAEYAGRWDVAARDWRSAGAVPGTNRFAVTYAGYRARAAEWIHQNRN